jgi:hypothetical protein
MVDLLISDVPQPTQDGGKCSDIKMLLSQMRKERYLKFKETLTRRIETLRLNHNTEESTNNGTSSMLMNGRVNPAKVNLTKSSVSMSKEISTLFLNYQTTDMLKFTTTETCLSRHQMEEDNKSGISINNP